MIPLCFFFLCFLCFFPLSLFAYVFHCVHVERIGRRATNRAGCFCISARLRAKARRTEWSTRMEQTQLYLRHFFLVEHYKAPLRNSNRSRRASSTAQMNGTSFSFGFQNSERSPNFTYWPHLTCYGNRYKIFFYPTAFGILFFLLLFSMFVSQSSPRPMLLVPFVT